MTSALPVHVALVDETGKVDPAELAKWAGALNEHVQSDFAPVWHVRATVGAYPSLKAVAPGTWAVVIKTKLDELGALGYHTDVHGQPISYVELRGDTSVTVGHELDEMLADPFGYRMHGARLPAGLEREFADFGLKHESTHVSYLLEVCDPCEATSYEVGGVAVSDFLRPGWYRTNPAVAPAYSHAGGCSEPRQVADGGYVSFRNPLSSEWFQAFGQGGQLRVQDLGKFSRSALAEHGSLRAWADHHARAWRRWGAG